MCNVFVADAFGSIWVTVGTTPEGLLWGSRSGRGHVVLVTLEIADRDLTPTLCLRGCRRELNRELPVSQFRRGLRLVTLLDEGSCHEVGGALAAVMMPRDPVHGGRCLEISFHALNSGGELSAMPVDDPIRLSSCCIQGGVSLIARILSVVSRVL